jgi:hypothetical protein
MSVSIEEMLCRIELDAPPAVLRKARLLLKSSKPRPEGLKPVRTKAEEALRVWETRLRSVKFSGVSSQGIQALVKKLKRMPPESEIEQFGFAGEKIAGSIFFNPKTGEFMGETIVRAIAKPKRKPIGIIIDHQKPTEHLSSRRHGESA